MGHERTSNKAEGKCGGLKTNSVMCRFVSETLARVHSPPMTLAAYGDWIDFRSKNWILQRPDGRKITHECGDVERR